MWINVRAQEERTTLQRGGNPSLGQLVSPRPPQPPDIFLLRQCRSLANAAHWPCRGCPVRIPPLRPRRAIGRVGLQRAPARREALVFERCSADDDHPAAGSGPEPRAALSGTGGGQDAVVTAAREVAAQCSRAPRPRLRL